MKPVFFQGELVRLRAMEPEDLEVLYRMENDPETWDVSNFTVPYSKYVLKQYMEESQSDMFADRQLRLMIVRCEDGQVVGTVDVTDFVPIHRRGEIGIAIRKIFQGKGYAREALSLLCDYLFGFLFMHQLTAHVAVDNEASRHLFASCGFVECGVLKEWWFAGGQYKDVVMLQRLHP
ncbi:GNAT family N-acetyltransferase [uncultured Mediterranea sp.]|uniref:GNAT family N-acetyltransferase n=1 Tax=uncultured Mediterranea sp. TaxID=1926662 RepID=UPI00258AE4FD|nr:GNAT family N-acetyltransferase [uncultured Mediterranea sp.]